MEATMAASLFRWLAMIELPVLGAMFWLVWRTRRDGEIALSEQRRGLEGGLGRLRDDVAAYKLDVAKGYASIQLLKDVERRLTRHLVRIETKLDRRSQHQEDHS
ncbi:MAG: hypothetical protein ACKVKG_01060 [Alphaproteobacteria bacterium]|jgi:hypothetical protein